MARLILIFLVTVFSCSGNPERNSNEVSEKSKTVRLQLIDSLGTIDLSIPVNFDTSFAWIHYFDCGKPCDVQKYRYQPRSLPFIKESGMLWLKPTDSTERLTVSHSMDFPFHDADTSNAAVAQHHQHFLNKLKSNIENPPIILDTIQRIGDRYFSIFVLEKSDTVQLKEILAMTTIKGNEIKFEYELLSKKNDSIAKNFIKNSLSLIRTIRITKGL